MEQSMKKSILNIEEFERLKKELFILIEKIVGQKKNESFIQVKRDKTLVTKLDLEICKFVEEKILPIIELKSVNYYSEENQNEFKFPCLILDPIDGTREFVAGRPECVISLSLLVTGKKNDPHFSWIYNPFSGFQIQSDWQFLKVDYKPEDLYLGLVSRSEWEKGLFDQVQSTNVKLVPRGSIAFKLALLASGTSDFVLSRRPKNVWDIAAGTALLWDRGYEFVSNGKIVKDLTEASYQAPLFWGKLETFEKLKDIIL